jgi:hypothetical protein
MLTTKTSWDINRRIHDPLQKVNFRQYLTDKTEPAEESSGKTVTTLDVESGIIKDTHLRKRVLRKVALRLRLSK